MVFPACGRLGLAGVSPRISMPTASILVNGHPVDTVSVFDRGLAYGDGVFETIKVVDRTPVLWDLHQRRLGSGCQQLGIDFDLDCQQLLRSEVAGLCRQLEGPAAVIKIIITRGAGGRGYRPNPKCPPQRIISAAPLPQYPPSYQQSGIKLTLCHTRLSLNPRLAGIKHLNRLEQVLARSEWQDQFAEGVVRDYADHVVEGTMSNLFLIAGNQLRTPRLDQSGVNGVIRQVICHRAACEGLAVAETPISVDQMKQSESLFMTNSLIGLWPVASFCGQRYAISPLVNQVRGWITEAEQQSMLEFSAGNPS